MFACRFVIALDVKQTNKQSEERYAVPNTGSTPYINSHTHTHTHTQTHTHTHTSTTTEVRHADRRAFDMAQHLSHGIRCNVGPQSVQQYRN